MHCGRPRNFRSVAAEIAGQVVSEEFLQQRVAINSESRHRLQELQQHVLVNGFKVGVRVRHKYTSTVYAVVAITKRHQLVVREVNSRVPKKGSFAPDVFELID